MPETGNSLAASIMATALSTPHNGRDGAASVEKVASDVGQQLGTEICGLSPLPDLVAAWSSQIHSTSSSSRGSGGQPSHED